MHSDTVHSVYNMSFLPFRSPASAYRTRDCSSAYHTWHRITWYGSVCLDVLDGFISGNQSLNRSDSMQDAANLSQAFIRHCLRVGMSASSLMAEYGIPYPKMYQRAVASSHSSSSSCLSDSIEWNTTLQYSAIGRTKVLYALTNSRSLQ